MNYPVSPEECPHMTGEFIDVVHSAERGYEQRWRCPHCGSYMFVQLGPFGPMGMRWETRSIE